MTLEIDRGRLWSEREALAPISEAPPPVVTRVVFTPADLQARAFVKRLCAEAGLRAIDRHPELAPAASGSHIYAIRNAGRFDGTAGGLDAIEGSLDEIPTTAYE
jgi:ureidoglycolate amidohydrolase